MGYLLITHTIRQLLILTIKYHDEIFILNNISDNECLFKY